MLVCCCRMRSTATCAALLLSLCTVEVADHHFFCVSCCVLLQVKMRLLDPCKDGAELGCSHAAAMREEAKALCAELAMTPSPAMNIINHHRQL